MQCLFIFSLINIESSQIIIGHKRGRMPGSQRLLKGFSRVQVERSSDLILPTGMIKRSKITQADCNIRMHLAKQAMFQGKDELLKRDSACIIAHISSQYR